MAGKHARPAPLVISRAVATLVMAALLLAVGVAAMTVFTGGERPATGGPRAGGPTVTTGPSAAPTPTTGATSGDERGDDTRVAEPTGVGNGGSSFGDGDFVDLAASSASGRTPAGMPQTSGASTGSPSSAASPASLPGVAPEVVAWPRGWAQRSETGRAHGKAVGLLRHVAAGHGCRPVPSRTKPIAGQPEPVGCR